MKPYFCTEYLTKSGFAVDCRKKALAFKFESAQNAHKTLSLITSLSSNKQPLSHTSLKKRPRLNR